MLEYGMLQNGMRRDGIAGATMVANSIQPSLSGAWSQGVEHSQNGRDRASRNFRKGFRGGFLKGFAGEFGAAAGATAPA